MFGLLPDLLQYVAVLGWFLVPRVFGIWFPFFGWQTILLVGAGILASTIGPRLADGVPVAEALTPGRRVRVSEEGVRMERLFGSRLIGWWEIRAVEAKDDVSYIRCLTERRPLVLDCSPVAFAKRKELVVALRARLVARGQDVVPWADAAGALSSGGRLALRVAGPVLMFAGFGFALFGDVAGPLGLRCSAASDYVQDRFDTADARGCVVLRVSAAADHAGMRQGDLMIEMNGIPIVSGAQFGQLFEDADGRSFAFAVLRPGVAEPLRFEVHMGDAGKPPSTDKDDPLFYYLRARWDAADGAVEGPIKDYTKAIELEPRFDIAYLYRGDLYAGQGNRDAAYRDYQRALELSPNLGEAHRFIAWWYAGTFDLDRALAHARRAIELDECEGGFVTYNIDCGHDLFVLSRALQPNDWSAAANAAKRSIEFYPHSAPPYAEAAATLQMSGDLAQAKEYARRYLEFSDDETDSVTVSGMEMILDWPESTPSAPVSPTPH